MSIKTKLIFFLSAMGIFLAIKDKDLAFISALCVSVAAAAAVELIVVYIKTRALRISQSSLITGLIIGFVISSDAGWLNIIITCSVAILSKHIIRFHKRHIFNPAAFGIFFAIILLGASTQWKATYMWYALIPFGIYFARSINKLEIIYGYAVVSLLLFGGQAIMQKTALPNIFLYFSYFYIFIMLIEPKTTPITKKGKYIFGITVAALVFIMTSAGVGFDVELSSLLAANCAVPVLNILK
ncbi:MAG: hypothetical protein COU52_04850 [Candidatus Omnitrophica bacterium CG10_big_fil_rev_8_21_14_0_10_43_8]|nr:MAG: hypothetical protein COU52_04850 [Candidatus Omnitrophica bacterium CG10_big_fil_rev_8_21_14_0_10_43_8]